MSEPGREDISTGMNLTAFGSEGRGGETPTTSRARKVGRLAGDTDAITSPAHLAPEALAGWLAA